MRMILLLQGPIPPHAHTSGLLAAALLLVAIVTLAALTPRRPRPRKRRKA